MKEEDKILQEFGRTTGFEVPEGYFDKMRAEVMEKLPPMEMPEPMVNRSFWQKVKPYVYLAAMFAGIWMMMNMFNRVMPFDRVNLEQLPEHIAMAMTESDVSDLVPDEGFVDEYDLVEDVVEQYSDIDEFEKDFGYEFEPEYSEMDIPESDE